MSIPPITSTQMPQVATAVALGSFAKMQEDFPSKILEDTVALATNIPDISIKNPNFVHLMKHVREVAAQRSLDNDSTLLEYHKQWSQSFQIVPGGVVDSGPLDQDLIKPILSACYGVGAQKRSHVFADERVHILSAKQIQPRKPEQDFVHRFKVQTTSRSIASFVENFRQSWDKLDQNKDGQLSYPEIHLALLDTPQGLSGPQVAVAAQYFHLLSKLSYDKPKEHTGLTLLDLENLQNPDLGAARNKVKSAVSDTLAYYESLDLDKIEKNTTTTQGLLGDCWLMAPLAGLSLERKKQLVQPQQDGSYVVRFPNQEQMRVDGLSPAESYLFNPLNSKEDQILEKIMNNRMWPMMRKGQLPLKGGFAEEAIAYLSGQKSRVIPLRQSSQIPITFADVDLSVNPENISDIFSVVQNRLKEGLMVVATTEKAENDKVTLPNHISKMHAYTVVSATEADVTVRNPNGFDFRDDDHQNDGVVTLSWHEFLASFDKIILERSVKK